MSSLVRYKTTPPPPPSPPTHFPWVPEHASTNTFSSLYKRQFYSQVSECFHTPLFLPLPLPTPTPPPPLLKALSISTTQFYHNDWRICFRSRVHEWVILWGQRTTSEKSLFSPPFPSLPLSSALTRSVSVSLSHSLSFPPLIAFRPLHPLVASNSVASPPTPPTGAAEPSVASEACRECHLGPVAPPSLSHPPA